MHVHSEVGTEARGMVLAVRTERRGTREAGKARPERSSEALPKCPFSIPRKEGLQAER